MKSLFLLDGTWMYSSIEKVKKIVNINADDKMYMVCFCWILWHINHCWYYKTRSCLDLKKQKERKEEKKKKTEVNTSSSQLKMKS